MMLNHVRYPRVSFSAVHQVNVQGDPKLSNPMGSKLKVTRRSSAVAWKVFGYIQYFQEMRATRH